MSTPQSFSERTDWTQRADEIGELQLSEQAAAFETAATDLMEELQRSDVRDENGSGA